MGEGREGRQQQGDSKEKPAVSTLQRGLKGGASLSSHLNSICIIRRPPQAALGPAPPSVPQSSHTCPHTLCNHNVPPRQVAPVSFRRRKASN